MSGLISVVTAVRPAGGGYLREAYGSIVRQDMPAGWAWQWVVQEDGETGFLPAELPGDPRISSGHGRSGGPGVARTLALSRVEGALVKVLDADDMLTGGALARDIAILDGHPEPGWTTSTALDLRPDGSRVRVAGFGEGPVGRSAVFDHWRSHDHQLPVHPATLCIRRDLLLALGGWMALPASEDTGLLVAASVASQGYHIDEPGLLYRQWPGQMTTRDDPAERAARMRVIEARGFALSRS